MTLVVAVDQVTGRRAYAVGPSAVAFTLPGLGRADGLAALARIESRTASSGHAVEWEPGETPVELVARLLAEPRDASRSSGPRGGGPEPSASAIRRRRPGRPHPGAQGAPAARQLG